MSTHQEDFILEPALFTPRGAAKGACEVSYGGTRKLDCYTFRRSCSAAALAARVFPDGARSFALSAGREPFWPSERHERIYARGCTALANVPLRPHSHSRKFVACLASCAGAISQAIQVHQREFRCTATGALDGPGPREGARGRNCSASRGIGTACGTCCNLQRSISAVGSF